MVIVTHLISVKGSMKWAILNVLGLGGSRDLTVTLAMAIKPRMRKPHTRMLQPYPILGMIWDTMIGRMTPPSPDPAAMMPYAAPRFFMNHDVTELVAVTTLLYVKLRVGKKDIPAVKIQLSPRALQIPCAKRNW